MYLALRKNGIHSVSSVVVLKLHKAPAMFLTISDERIPVIQAISEDILLPSCANLIHHSMTASLPHYHCIQMMS